MKIKNEMKVNKKKKKKYSRYLKSVFMPII